RTPAALPGETAGTQPQGKGLGTTAGRRRVGTFRAVEVDMPGAAPILVGEVQHGPRLGVELDAEHLLRLLHESEQLSPAKSRRVQNIVGRPRLIGQTQLCRFFAEGRSGEYGQVEHLQVAA